MRAWPARRATLTIGAIVALLIVFFSFARPLARTALIAGLRVAGFDVTSSTLEVGLRELHARDLVVRSAHGEPIATVRSLDLRYSLRFGLRSFRIDRPQLTLIRHKDGSWNVPQFRASSEAPSSTPLAFDGTIRRGSIDVYDGAQGVPQARHLEIRHIDARLHVASAARTQYAAHATYVEDGQAYPIDGRGDIDEAAGVADQRWTARVLPIARIVDVTLNSPSMHLASGELASLDARIVGAPDAGGTLVMHPSVTAVLRNARLGIGGMPKPLRDLHGPISAFGDGLVLHDVRGTLAGVPVTLRGGVYNLVSPRLALVARARGPLERLRQALAQTTTLPLVGAAAVDVRVEGAAAAPMMFVALDMPDVRYRGVPFQHAGGLIAFDGVEADIARFDLGYAGMHVRTHGRLALHARTNALQMVGALDTPGDEVPYAGALVPQMPLHATVVATGNALANATTHGLLFGRDGARTLGGTFDVSSNGIGTIGPLRLRGPSESLDAVAFVDHPHGRANAVLDAANAHFDTTRTRALPGLAIASLPALAGQLDGHVVATVRDASLSAHGRVTIASGASVAQARGSLVDSGRPTQHYDVAARVHTADLGALARLVNAAAGRIVEGSGSADLRIRGSDAGPVIAGRMNAHEGAVNGLAFHALNVDVDGTAAHLAMQSGHIGVGTTAVAFSGESGAAGTTLSVRAPHANLRDFNDAFDQGDMLGGEGSLSARVAFGAHGLQATNGALAFANASVRGVQLGTTRAAWSGSSSAIAADVAIAGRHGRASASGTLSSTGAMNVRARVRGMDLAAWLPTAGTTPVTGLADADIRARGAFPAIDAAIHAHIVRAGVGRVPIRALTANADIANGRGRLAGLWVDLQAARMHARGTFGLRPGDALALSIDAQAPSIHALAGTLGLGSFDAEGAVTTTARVFGTIRAPRIDDRVDLANARYRGFDVPHAFALVQVDPHAATLRASEIDLVRGRMRASARIPIDPRNRAIAGRITFDDIEGSDVAGLMPAGARVAGRLDGTVDVGGSVHAPHFAGALALAGGSYSGPAERVPITGAHARVVFAGTRVLLRDAHADAGGGSLDASGTAEIPDVRDVSAMAFDLRASARHTFLDLPSYAKGRFDADIHATRASRERPLIGGTLAMRDARIPVSALYNPNAANAPQAPRPDVGLALRVRADRDVRVVSPNVDIAAAGAVNINGTLAAPSLDGSFASTGGTVSFYRTLRLERGEVTFAPEDGIIPTVDAVATTSVADPATDIVLHVAGPATNMHVDFASDPSYDREQILALLVNAGGGGAHAPALAQLASGEINTAFTRTVLEPFSAQLGEGLGLEHLEITNDLQGGLGLNARKGVGKHLNVVYADTFGLPRRSSLSLQTRYESRTQFALTMFNTQGATIAGMEQPVLVNALAIGNAATLPPDTGANGFNLQLKRTYP